MVLKRGRRLKLDGLSGAVIPPGEETGVPAPIDVEVVRKSYCEVHADAGG